ncbi:MAG: hypothetical protein AUJ92_08660 [Armatimonadetes bacterium CG2_30_59_28]|nr:MAG: hypothetical protein AUJ92_08660 [Armatimonadetes bacterium CG2_30_59_28]
MREYGLYLGGKWQRPGPMLNVVNPALGEVFARVATVERERVRAALDAANQAWDGWRRTTAKERGQFLLRIADELGKRADEVARTITLENGKPLAQSKAEVGMSIDHLQWFAEEGRRAYGRVVPHQMDGKRHLVLRSPVGVVGAIAPWNFPLVLAVRKVAPALAAGCPVILKPASATPINAVLFSECVAAAGVPPGVYQMVVGPAQMIADEFLTNPICRKLSFTGSTAVGRSLIEGSAKNMVSLSTECGGHAPLLVFADADFDAAMEGALVVKFRNTGQSCIAANRIFVQRPIYGRFLEVFVDRAGKLKVGNGLDEGVDIGPLINEEALNGALNHINDAVANGAQILCGGKRHECGNGFFLQPTVLVEVPDDALCMREETFAPVAPVCVFDDEDEAMRRANASRYGLAAYAFTSNFSRAMRVMEQLEAGTVCINDPVPATSPCPFGGMKQSGLGRELGIEGLDAYLETKHVSIGGIG